MSVLNYVVYYPASVKAGLSIYDSETYDAAVGVQQLVGNLIYYSNFGRYEPRIAKRWAQISANTWRFELHEGFTCENGEPITAEGFRDSLIRSIRNQEKRGGALIFRKLRGFAPFISGHSELKGLKAEKNVLTFDFETPVRDGLLETLSYAPYGYLCAENFNSDGTWKDELKFISSGPYQVRSIEIGRQIALGRRKEWRIPFAEGAPDLVYITYIPPSEIDLGRSVIIDINRIKPDLLDNRLIHFRAVPEYMSAVVLGNLEKGFFSNKENRMAFKERFESQRHKEISVGTELWTRADSFYPNQESSANKKPIENPAGYKHQFSLQTTPLRIFGNEAPAGSEGAVFYNLLRKVLEEAGLRFQYTGATNTFEAISDKTVDIRMFAQSIGGEVRPWTLRVIFCSPLSYGFPDPTGRICKMVDEYDESKLSLEDVTRKFLETVEDDAAIFPLRHFGQNLFVTESIDLESFGPSFSILRFDQLRISK